MFKMIKILAQGFVFIGLALICVNGYEWTTTGEWGAVSFFDMLSFFTGTKVEMPETDRDFLYNLVN